MRCYDFSRNEDLEDSRDVAVPVGVKYESSSPFSSNHTIFSPTLEPYTAKLDVVYSVLHSSSKLRLEYLIAHPFPLLIASTAVL